MVYTHFFRITGITLLFTGNLCAQTTQKLNIEQATVFLSGAELVSTAKINLQKGEHEVIFNNVAGNVNDQSITVNATNGVVVAGVTFQNNYLVTDSLSPRAKDIKDSIMFINGNKQLVNSKIKVLNVEIETITDNKKVSGANTGLSVAELTKMLDLINTRLEGYYNQKNKLEDQLKKIDERLANLNKQLDEEQKRDYQPGGQLLVKFYAKEATATAIAISYVVPNAGWTPTYDVMADDAHSPIKLYYKANISQNSGVKWNNVRLTLSTGNPNEGVDAPVINPWYLAFYVPQVYAKSYSNAPSNSNRGADVNVSGARTSGTEYYVDGVQVRNNSMDEYITVDNSGVNTSFDIDLPYTIPSDGQQHLVAIKKYELPATYRYYSVPKLDKDAFLQAQITGWEDLNLLPGQTNIFYEGTFVGQGNIDVHNVKDTMTLSLGRDKKIIVKRERDVKLRSVKTIGTNVRETFAYNITARNSRKENITLIIMDQQPVSNDKDIVLEDMETGGSEYDATTGMMKWAVPLNSNESKKITFGYTVKYPKGKTIANLPR